MSRRKLSEALASRSPLARRETAESLGRPAEGRPGSGTGETTAEEAAARRSEGSGSAEGTAASGGDRDDEVVVLVAARPAQPRAAAAPAVPALGTPGIPGGQGGQGGQGQAALERWVDAQRELWDAWFALAEQTLPAPGPGLPVGWGRPVLWVWRETTRQLLDVQAAWLRCWAPRTLGHQAGRHDQAGGRSPE